MIIGLWRGYMVFPRGYIVLRRYTAFAWLYASLVWLFSKFACLCGIPWLYDFGALISSFWVVMRQCAATRCNTP